METSYSYEPEGEIDTFNRPDSGSPLDNPENKVTDLYSTAIKELAQSKVFKIKFIDGSEKVYQRRKASLGEVGEYEEKKQYMFQFKGKPKLMNEAIVNFYTYAASVHLRETRNNGTMTADEVKNTVFEDFKRIIDACEYAMLFNPN